MGRGGKKGKRNSEKLMDKAILGLFEAAAQIDHLDLADFLHQTVDRSWFVPEKQILILVDYYGTKFSQVSFPWLNMFESTPIPDLVKVPLYYFSKPVYETSVSFIDTLTFNLRGAFVLWASHLILTEWPGVTKVEQVNGNKPRVAVLVVLAMVLRSNPDALIAALPEMRKRDTYEGEDKLPFIIWMMAQASQGDLSVGLYSWTRDLVPLLDLFIPQGVNLILDFAELILSNPEAETILVNEADWNGERLVPPCSIKILMKHTFLPSFVRVKEIKRFMAIYPLLKEVALAPDSGNTMKEMLTFSLKLAGEGNQTPVLAKEATEIAIRCVTLNVDCFKHWDILYEENIEGSVALLKKLVEEWEYHSRKLLSSSPSDTLDVKHTIYRFMMKNERAIVVANGGSLYKEADKYCKLILGRLSRGLYGIKIKPFTAMVIAAAAAVAGRLLVQIWILLLSFFWSLES